MVVADVSAGVSMAFVVFGILMMFASVIAWDKTKNIYWMFGSQLFILISFYIFLPHLVEAFGG